MDNLPPCLAAQAAFLTFHAIPAPDVRGLSASLVSDGRWYVTVNVSPQSAALRRLISDAESVCRDSMCNRIEWRARVVGGSITWETPDAGSPFTTTAADALAALAALPVAP